MMSIRDDLLSDDVSVVSKGLDELDVRLRKKEDHADLLDVLFVLSSSHVSEIVQKASWCAGKMGQNKVGDERIISLLTGLSRCDDEQVRENVAWGIGETAGTVSVGDDAIATVSVLLDDDEKDVRGMAAWAAGRFHHKCDLMPDDIKAKLEFLLYDASEYVRAAAKFALDDE
ncbi:MAG: HEAT repeat domain-containing protein [Methanomassiliicoccaceae archaeon]|nr:HEAT repeat domain-containing protein [Methanomassiliicoccaceae archaeon]